jgi:hypothetical protein
MINRSDSYNVHVQRIDPPGSQVFELFVTLAGHGVVQGFWRYPVEEDLHYALSRLGVPTGDLLELSIGFKHSRQHTIDGTWSGHELLDQLGIENLGSISPA